jgi:hypothetical protein
MKLILAAPNPELFTAFQEYFFYLPHVKIANNYFEDLREYDCLVSPANLLPPNDNCKFGKEARLTLSKYQSASLFPSRRQKLNLQEGCTRASCCPLHHACTPRILDVPILSARDGEFPPELGDMGAAEPYPIALLDYFDFGLNLPRSPVSPSTPQIAI